jgi:hypothetical protein
MVNEAEAGIWLFSTQVFADVDQAWQAFDFGLLARLSLG